MKKGMILVLAVCCAMSVLAPGMTATAYAVEENVVIADQVTESNETRFVADSSVASVSVLGEIAEPLFKHGSDVEKAITDIESGRIKPVSPANLPQGVSADDSFDFVEDDGTGQTIILSEIKTIVNCKHSYELGIFAVHGKNSDGSCDITTFDALRCSKCNSIWILEVIGTAHFRVCPH